MSFSKELLLAALRGHTDKPIDPTGKELREDLKECEPKPAGAGGVSSWNDIPDRPFGEVYGDTLTWDGNTEGLESVQGMLFKISDVILSENDIATAIVKDAEGNEAQISEENRQYSDDGCGMIGAFPVGAESPSDVITFYSIPTDNFDMFGDGSFIIPSAGLWLASLHLCSFTIPGYTGFPSVKKLDAKYLPGTAVLYVDAENYLYTTSDTSDTSKRMTRAELQAVMQSGCTAYVSSEDETGVGYLPVQMYAFAPDFGKVTCVLFFAGSQFMNVDAYTAEYTPESTASE